MDQCHLKPNVWAERTAAKETEMTTNEQSTETSQPGEVRSSEGLGVLLEGCTVAAYYAGQDVRIEAAKQIDGSTKWAIRSRGSVMGITGEWEWEPLPSSRDDEFMIRCRFSTPAEALACLQRARRNA